MSNVMDRINQLQNSLPEDDRIIFNQNVITRGILCDKSFHLGISNTTLCAKSLVCEEDIFIREIIQNIDEAILLNKFQKEDDLFALAATLRALEWAHSSWTKKFASKLLNTLSDKIIAIDSHQIKNIIGAGFILWALCTIDEALGERVFSVASDSIKKEIKNNVWLKLEGK